MTLRLVAMGTPDFALPAFEALRQAGHDIVCAYTQPPRPAGRGHRLTASPVQLWAEARNIPVRSPASLRDAAVQAAFAALGADAAVVAAYGLLLPRPVLEAPARGCLNIHASLLPRWRGAAPIQRAILAGDGETGITIMQMDVGLDTGAILLREATLIGPDEDAGSLHDRLAGMGARLIVAALAVPSLAVPQPAEGVTYAVKLGRGEERIDWNRPAADLARHVRAFAPAPGAWFEFGGERIKVLAAREEAGAGPPGLLLDEGLLVACLAGALRLLRVQRAGRAPMPAAEFLRGFALAKGERLATLEADARI